jgi:hypothetical protein
MTVSHGHGHGHVCFEPNKRLNKVRRGAHGTQQDWPHESHVEQALFIVDVAQPQGAEPATLLLVEGTNRDSVAAWGTLLLGKYAEPDGVAEGGAWLAVLAGCASEAVEVNGGSKGVETGEVGAVSFFWEVKIVRAGSGTAGRLGGALGGAN